MDEKLFNELVESLREGMGIIRGEIKPSRVFENLKEVKDEYFPNIKLEELRNPKKSEWNFEEIKPRNPYRNRIIICQHCHKNSGYTEEGFQFYVISSDIKCRQCGKVIIHYDGGVRC